MASGFKPGTSLNGPLTQTDNRQSSPRAWQGKLPAGWEPAVALVWSDFLKPSEFVASDWTEVDVGTGSKAVVQEPFGILRITTDTSASDTESALLKDKYFTTTNEDRLWFKARVKFSTGAQEDGFLSLGLATVAPSVTAAVAATLIVQDLTYTAAAPGLAGDDITIEYLDTNTGAAAAVSVTGTAISVSIESGATTATTIESAINGSAPALALVSVAVTGTGSNTQVAAAATPLDGGADSFIVQPTDALVFEIDNGSSDLICKCIGASSETAVTLDEAVDLSDWVELALVTDGLRVDFYVNNQRAATITTDIPLSSVSLATMFMVSTEQDAARALDIDYFMTAQQREAEE